MVTIKSYVTGKKVLYVKNWNKGTRSPAEEGEGVTLLGLSAKGSGAGLLNT
jgi:hypothetical protein